MKDFLVVGNLKMNLLSESESEHYLSELRKAAYGKHFAQVTGIIAPPFVHLYRFSHLPTHFSLAAQDVHWEKSGAATGSISPLMLKSFGVSYVILGHSERRSTLGETDALVRTKVDAALKHNLTPIVCIGETREERDRDETTHVVTRQLETTFAGLSSFQAEKVIIAYEPRWAISTSGTGQIPTTTDIFQVKVFIRKWFTEHFDARVADKIQVLYGGSVNSMLLPTLSWEAEMDGVLVGKESLFPRELIKMMEMAGQYFKTVT
jgi:triosephosphate isomerase